MAAPLSRRAVVRVPVLAMPALLVPTLAGCTDDRGPDGAASSAPPGASRNNPAAPHPDVGITREALAGVQRLLVAYAGTIARLPRLASRLGPLAGEHDAHAAALQAALGGRATAPPPPGTTAIPGETRAARLALAALEDKESGRRRAQALRASPELARVLGAIAGAEAAHAALLRRSS